LYNTFNIKYNNIDKNNNIKGIFNKEEKGRKEGRKENKAST